MVLLKRVFLRDKAGERMGSGWSSCLNRLITLRIVWYGAGYTRNPDNVPAEPGHPGQGG